MQKVGLRLIDKKREEYSFEVRNLLLNDYTGKRRLYFFIVLVHHPLGEIVCFTRFEKYVMDFTGSRTVKSETTIRNAMSRAVSFMNYVLHETGINQLHKVSVNTIRNYLEWAKKKDNEQYKREIHGTSSE